MGRLAQADSIGRTVGTTLTAVMGPASVALKDRSEVVSIEGLEGLLAQDMDLAAIIGQMPEDAGRGLSRKIVAFVQRCVMQLSTDLSAEADRLLHRFDSVEDANKKRDEIMIDFKDQLVSARKECRESIKTGEGTARGRLALRKIDASQFKDQMHVKIEEMIDERSKIDQLIDQIAAKDVSLAESDIDSYIDSESEKHDRAKKRRFRLV